MINIFVQEREVLVSAPTGSGKTMAFGIPLILNALKRISQVGAMEHELHAVVLEPTQELAKQVNTSALHDCI